MLASLLFDKVYDSREPSFTGKALYSRKKLLKTCKAFFSFDLYQRVFVPLPRFMPATRNQRSICADVFVLYQTKSRRFDKLFVDSKGHEQEKTDRTTQR